VSDGRLQIEFERSGGFAGVALRKSVDAGDLPPAEAEELRTLVERALPGLAESSPGPGPGKPDRFQYDLTVTIDDRVYRVTLGEAELPDDAKPLVDKLLVLARQR
jgi:emfourin